jgi:hypothetical protein
MTTNGELDLVLHFNEETKQEKIKISNDFNETKRNILKKFGIKDKEIDNYALKIPNGGLIEKSNIIFAEDNLCIIPTEMSNEPTGYTPLDEHD